MNIRKIKNICRKILGLFLLLLGSWGLGFFVVELLFLVYGKEFFSQSQKGLILLLLSIFLISSLLILFLGSNLLHCKGESVGRKK